MFLDAGGLFEENAWRGFALPWLQARHSPVIASVILGSLWSLWHVPVKLPIILDFGPVAFIVLFAVLTVKFILLSLVMAYFFNRAGAATLTAIAGHGLSNDSMGIGGMISSERFADQLAYEALLIVPMAVVTLVLVAVTKGRLGLPGRAAHAMAAGERG